MFFWLGRMAKRRILAGRPMPEGWEALARARFPLLAALDAAEQGRFFLHLKVFGLEKRFEGAQGLVLTEEMKVVVAGAAARLARNLPLDAYDGLTTVLLYDSAWKGRDGESRTLGEAHRLGLVVLAWDSVRRGLANPADGEDVALHELAHTLDLADGSFDGTPALNARGDYHAWARVFHQHYVGLREAPGRHLLDAYGATNEAEFFAVATEAFFEKPAQMQARAPDLYAELKRFYRLDPRLNRG